MAFVLIHVLNFLHFSWQGKVKTTPSVSRMTSIRAEDGDVALVSEGPSLWQVAGISEACLARRKD